MLFVSTKIPSKGEQRIVADPKSAAPAVTCRVAAVLRKALAVKGWELLESAYYNSSVNNNSSNLLTPCQSEGSPRRISKL